MYVSRVVIALLPAVLHLAECVMVTNSNPYYVVQLSTVGDTWIAVKNVDPSNAGYSSMQFLHADQSSVGILWEQADEAKAVMLPDRIVFEAFSADELHP